jgi:Flp pilus assembly protein TadD
VERLALLPANILTAESSAEWLKTGVPLVLQEDLATAHGVVVSGAANESDATQAAATRLLRTTVENHQGRIRIETSLVDAKSQKNLSFQSIEADSLDRLLPALNTLAKRIDAHASEFSSKKIAVLQAAAAAAAATDPQTRVQRIAQALQTDPSFGLGYIALLEILSRSNEQNAKSVITQGQKHRSSFTPYDQVKFDVIAARALHAPLSQQVKAADALLKVAPNEVDALAVLGLARFLKGDAAGGEHSFQRALRLSPTNPNLQQQFALGLIQVKRFGEAEKILAGLDKIPATRLQLAICILLEGDLARARGVAEKFIAQVPNPDVQILVRTFWLGVSGDRQKAIQVLETAAFSNPSLQASAMGEAAVWRMIGKDYAGAKKDAARAAAPVAGQPAAAPFGEVVALLTDGGRSASEWRAKVDAAGIAPEAKETVLGYGYFLHGYYVEASTIWRTIVNRTEGADLRARTMLAASLERAGKKSEARQVAVQPFLPEFGDLYGVISFDEMRRILGLRPKT